MSYLSNTATPKYFAQFRDLVIRGEIPVCKEISMEMYRIQDLIDNPGVYYDPEPVEAFINFCEGEIILLRKAFRQLDQMAILFVM